MKKHVVLIQFCEETPENEEKIPLRTAFLGQYLSKNDCQVTWIKSGFSHDAKQNLWGNSTKQLNENFEIIHVPGLGYKRNVCLSRYLHDWFCTKQTLQVLKKIGPIDAIVSCIPSVSASFFVSRFAQKHNIPFILDLRDAWPDSFPYAIENKLLRFFIKLAIIPDLFLLKQAIKKSSGLVSMSHDMLNWGLRKVNTYRNPTQLFYLGTVRDVKLTEKQQKYFSEKYANLLARKTFKVFYISRWGRVCNPQILLDVAKAMPKDNIDFVICGDGDYGKTIRENTKGLQNVFLPGFLSHEEAYFLAKHCQCGITFVTNESQEYDKNVVASFPNKSFFQFMCGMPLINGMRGELADVVENRQLGLNFYNNNLDQVKNCIFKLRENDALRLKMAENSRKFFEKCGNPEVVYQKYAEFVKGFCK